MQLYADTFDSQPLTEGDALHCARVIYAHLTPRERAVFRAELFRGSPARRAELEARREELALPPLRLVGPSGSVGSGQWAVGREESTGVSSAHYPLPTAHYPLPTAHCPLSAALCPLPTAHSPLPTAGCPLPTAHRPLPEAVLQGLDGPPRLLEVTEYFVDDEGQLWTDADRIELGERSPDDDGDDRDEDGDPVPEPTPLLPINADPEQYATA